ncbi:flagellar assembly protein FliH [Izhakiella capsodis]|uniref:Flagellar assembly protein FliH n=1 Tax=Izhakiella capsodis TaxID=1367852 RepID=A0A1I4YBQ0_9GAMM|nr:flagellar assembly protein FliH [Izhakiella capsodis]SFN35432.1 flagellar assembly protein FliH [Izhakiella capsodis]
MTLNDAIDGTLRLYHFPSLNKKPPEDATAALQETIDEDQLQQEVEQMRRNGFDQGHEQGYQAGRSAGYEEGHQQGRDEGLCEARSNLQQAVSPVDALVVQLRQTLDEYEQRRRDELMLLVEKVARQVIRCDLAIQPSQLLTLVDEALSSLPETPTRLQVLLNPDEFVRIQELAPEKVSAWGMTGDAFLEAGECRIVTDVGEMDIGCNHRLEQCIDALGKSLAAPVGGAGSLLNNPPSQEQEK